MRLHLRLTAHENYVATTLALAMMAAQFLLAVPMLVWKVRGLWATNAIELAGGVAAALVAGALLRLAPRLRRGLTRGAYAQLGLLAWLCWLGHRRAARARSPA
jgi:hypothetical protein